MTVKNTRVYWEVLIPAPGEVRRVMYDSANELEARARALTEALAQPSFVRAPVTLTRIEVAKGEPEVFTRERAVDSLLRA